LPDVASAAELANRLASLSIFEVQQPGDLFVIKFLLTFRDVLRQHEFKEV